MDVRNDDRLPPRSYRLEHQSVPHSHRCVLRQQDHYHLSVEYRHQGSLFFRLGQLLFLRWLEQLGAELAILCPGIRCLGCSSRLAIDFSAFKRIE